MSGNSSIWEWEQFTLPVCYVLAMDGEMMRKMTGLMVQIEWFGVKRGAF